MFRQTLTKTTSLRGIANSPSRRAFAATARAMAAGDTGAPPKTGGQGDAFQKREKASEDYAIRQREREKLLELKKKLAEQQGHLQKLSDHIDELTKEQGGEHN
ncbi:hypothetical protein DL766_008846 [Monosporascus sp. MC13-8B]|uniref:ATPase inhibitor, mitochondrial n=1 Tax=Monosporascus cannonballus TaxID=155416 RepID=A0ABY0GU31_9PEZI|nr:hypothetical protein DL762_009302 [Monosporascus cannonballus]RYO78966.1 hypothetical protein DL763_009453 [Monosporascus cannonballus]RYP17676.1 hypothetical protein DL766_008846 [Monosporascus sp. MC13-8B]